MSPRAWLALCCCALIIGGVIGWSACATSADHRYIRALVERNEAAADYFLNKYDEAIHENNGNILKERKKDMAKVTKIKAAAAAHRVPQTREEVVNMIAEIGSHQRDRQRLKADMDDQITAIREKFDQLLTPHSEAITALTAGCHTWCEANKDALTNGGKVKTANLMTGEVRWRIRPTSCKAVRIKEALEELKLKGLAAQFIRTKEELNKEAILANPDAIKDCRWISLEQGEDFVIVPFETDLEEVA